MRILIALAILASSSASFAQSKPPVTDRKTPPNALQRTIERRVESIDSYLDLNKDQEKKAMALLMKRDEASNKVAKDAKLTEKQRAAKVKAIDDQFNSGFKAILTPGQRKKYEILLSVAQKKRSGLAKPPKKNGG